MQRKRLGNIFSDMSSCLLRELLKEPEKKWVVRDFVSRGLSVGLASEVLQRAEEMGYVKRVRKGRKSFSQLIRKEKMLSDWVENYDFDKNKQYIYLTTEKDFLVKLRDYLSSNGIKYALTLFSAANLIAPYVKNFNHYVYLDLEHGKDREQALEKMRLALGLHELKQGGNVYLLFPYYRHAAFKDITKVKGFDVVSNLQLYLDLMGFGPEGIEQAKHMQDNFRKKGRDFV